MTATEATPPPPIAGLGLRERKKQRTRDAIADAALELFSKHGFHETTIREIAVLADVSARTVSSYFPVKEELAFPDFAAIIAELSRRLETREPGTTTADALRAWLVSILSVRGAKDKARARRRRTLIESEPALRAYERALYEQAELVIAAAVAVDLSLPADDLLPQMVAAATVAALDAMGRRQQRSQLSNEARVAHARTFIDDAMTFVGAGVRALAERSAAGEARAPAGSGRAPTA